MEKGQQYNPVRGSIYSPLCTELNKFLLEFHLNQDPHQESLKKNSVLAYLFKKFL